jgi:hypothetical protein
MSYEYIAVAVLAILISMILLRQDPFSDVPGDKYFFLFLWNFPEALEYRRTNKLNGFLKLKYQKYGKIFQMKNIWGTAIIVADADGIKQILTSSSFARTAIVQYALVDIMKYSLFALPTDDIWKRYLYICLISIDIES